MPILKWYNCVQFGIIMITSAEHIDFKETSKAINRGGAVYENKNTEPKTKNLTNEIEDKFIPSDNLKQLQDKSSYSSEINNNSDEVQDNKSKSEDTDTIEEKSDNKKELEPKEEKVVEKLEKQEAAVRTHEQAHLSAGGGLVRGGASFSYTTGPDGKQYISGGEVKIDISPVPDDPEGTIKKMQQVKRAALAPSDPSVQDRNVASQASLKESEARSELLSQKSEKVSNSTLKSKQKYSLEVYLKNELSSNDKAKADTAPNPSLK